MDYNNILASCNIDYNHINSFYEMKYDNITNTTKVANNFIIFYPNNQIYYIQYDNDFNEIQRIQLQINTSLCNVTIPQSKNIVLDVVMNFTPSKPFYYNRIIIYFDILNNQFMNPYANQFANQPKITLTFISEYPKYQTIIDTILLKFDKKVYKFQKYSSITNDMLLAIHMQNIEIYYKDYECNKTTVRCYYCLCSNEEQEKYMINNYNRFTDMVYSNIDFMNYFFTRM